MRIIGHLEEESSARTFADVLLAQGIASRLEQHPPEGWAVWVEDEDKLAEAAGLLEEFKANPLDQRFREAAARSASRRSSARKEMEAYQRRTRTRRDLFRPLTGYGFGPVTFVLIAASVLVFLLSSFGRNLEPLKVLFISNYTEDGSLIRWVPHLQEVRHGQVWRLVTPIFIHMNVLHILFNMLWLRDLGSMVEGRLSSWFLILFVLVAAVTSNVGQFYGSSPAFGGMSGVVYALLGFVWLRGKYDPASGLFLHQSTVTMMLVWFFLCLFGIIPGVANWAHGVGLGVGAAWGYVSAIRAPLKRR